MFCPRSSLSVLVVFLLFTSVVSRPNRHRKSEDDDDTQRDTDLFKLSDAEYLLLSDYQVKNAPHSEPLKTTLDPSIPRTFKFIEMKGSRTTIVKYGEDASQKGVPELALKIAKSGITTIDIHFKNFVTVKFPKDSVLLQLELIYGANKSANVTYLVDKFEDWCPLEDEHYRCERAVHTIHQVRGVMVPADWAQFVNDETPFSTLTVSLLDLPFKNVLMTVSALAKVV